MGPRFLHGRPVAGHIAECGGQSSAVVTSPRRKARAKARMEERSKAGKRPHMLRVWRDWTPREVVPSEGWVNDLEQDGAVVLLGLRAFVARRICDL